MNWTDIGKKLAEYGLPILGAAVGGPGGAALGKIVASTIGATSDDPDEIMKSLAINGDNIVKLREVEAQLALGMRQADSTDLQSVNQTMQAEAKSEHWAQWAWRPYNGFAFGTTLFGCYFVLPLMQIEPPVVPTEAWLAWGGVLGVASWWRGKQKTETAS